MLGLRIALISLVVGAAMLSACENPGVAVGAFGSCNELHLLYKPCQPDTLLFSVRVTAWDNSAVIWEISNPTGSLLREFVLGEEPAGFTSVVAFDGSLDVDKIRVAYSSDELDYEAEAIDLDNLREDQVYVPRRGHKTFEEYAEMTRCDKGRGPFT